MKILIINEQHTLLPQQEKLLKEQFDTWETIKVPAAGWTRREMDDFMDELVGYHELPTLIMVSPIPYLIREWAAISAYAFGYQDGYDGSGYHGGTGTSRVLLFHNDRREKKELPDGRVIYTVAKDGWELI